MQITFLCRTSTSHNPSLAFTVGKSSEILFLERRQRTHAYLAASFSPMLNFNSAIVRQLYTRVETSQGKKWAGKCTVQGISLSIFQIGFGKYMFT